MIHISYGIDYIYIDIIYQDMQLCLTRFTVRVDGCLRKREALNGSIGDQAVTDFAS